MLPTDLNNPSGQMETGFVATYAIDDEQNLAVVPVKTTAVIPFSIAEDMEYNGLFLTTDVTTGYAIYRDGPDASLVQGTIPQQGAVSLVYVI